MKLGEDVDVTNSKKLAAALALYHSAPWAVLTGGLMGYR